MQHRHQVSRGTPSGRDVKDVSTPEGSRETTGQGGELLAGGTESSQSGITTLPAVDIFEDEAGITVIADMPGVSKERLGVRVSGDSLVIEGTASVPVAGDVELIYGEVQNPQYRRSFTLSHELDPGKIAARLVNGVLTLTIPKAEEAKPRRITVSVA
ncbi:Hsp20/alpha crystallin family protein [Polaromonas jejuensis]|uniref:Hsp20/alpha crystallin family protein n=1 Tax=Polaromonas jejuensis TaxID=457502 RepID=A0ABW0QA06_9BURK|nr:Hsp20/alpha crystallin family protein [Polaromonas jejuensis]